MTTNPDNPLGINDGSRPSQLDLDRRLMGELSGEVPAAHWEQTEHAAQALAPLDLGALRRRAKVTDRPVRRPRRWMFAGLMAAGTLAAVGALVVQPSPRAPATAVRVKGGPQLSWMVLQGDEVRMGSDDRAVSPGDRLQFTWAGNVSSVVIVGVDGTGAQTVLWPASPDAAPIALDGASGMLEGSISLDDAPGPERFFAVFDAPSVSAATRRVTEAMNHADSASNLQTWVDQTPDVDVLILEKRLQ
jgi:hypothetical protein